MIQFIVEIILGILTTGGFVLLNRRYEREIINRVGTVLFACVYLTTGEPRFAIISALFLAIDFIDSIDRISHVFAQIAQTLERMRNRF